MILFSILALLAEIIGTVGGFGSSVFLIPIAGLFFDFQTVLAVTGLLHVFSNIIKIILFNKGLDKRLLLLIGIPAVIFVFLGSVLTTYIDLKYAEIILGMFLIVFSLIFLLKPLLALNPTTTNAIFGGGISGFLAGLIGTGGAIRGLSLAAFNLEKNAFIVTSAAIDLGVDMTRTSVYLYNNYLEIEYYYLIPILLVVAFIGSYIGKLILNKIPQAQFKSLVLLFIFSIGVFILIKYLAN